MPCSDHDKVVTPACRSASSWHSSCHARWHQVAPALTGSVVADLCRLVGGRRIDKPGVKCMASGQAMSHNRVKESIWLVFSLGAAPAAPLAPVAAQDDLKVCLPGPQRLGPSPVGCQGPVAPGTCRGPKLNGHWRCWVRARLGGPRHLLGSFCTGPDMDVNSQ